MKYTRLSVASSVALVIATISLDARADCTNDSQCKGDRICDKGVCVSAPSKAPPEATPPTAPPPTQPSPQQPLQQQQPDQQPIPTDAVRVTIEGPRNEHVRLEGGGNAFAQCRTPCTVAVSPGHYALRSKNFDHEVEIPAGRSSEIHLGKSCTACLIVGGVLAGAGIPFIVGGAVLLEDAKPTFNGQAYVASDTPLAGATVMIISGVALSVSGLVLLVVGAAKGRDTTVNGEPPPVRGDSRSPIRIAPEGVVLAF